LRRGAGRRRRIARCLGISRSGSACLWWRIARCLRIPRPPRRRGISRREALRGIPWRWVPRTWRVPSVGLRWGLRVRRCLAVRGGSVWRWVAGRVCRRRIALLGRVACLRGVALRLRRVARRRVVLGRDWVSRRRRHAPGSVGGERGEGRLAHRGVVVARGEAGRGVPGGEPAWRASVVLRRKLSRDVGTVCLFARTTRWDVRVHSRRLVVPKERAPAQRLQVGPKTGGLVVAHRRKAGPLRFVQVERYRYVRGGDPSVRGGRIVRARDERLATRDPNVWNRREQRGGCLLRPDRGLQEVDIGPHGHRGSWVRGRGARGRGARLGRRRGRLRGRCESTGAKDYACPTELEGARHADPGPVARDSLVIRDNGVRVVGATEVDPLTVEHEVAVHGKDAAPVDPKLPGPPE
jgi:hypothetical protein